LTRSRANILVLIAALAVLALWAPSAHASYQSAISDCSDNGQMDSHHSRSDIKKAYNHLPTDVAEYTDCRDVLRAALAAGAKPGGSGGGGSGYNPPANPSLTTGSGATASSPGDLKALGDATRHSADSRARAPKVSIAGIDVSPGQGGLANAASTEGANKLPHSLLWSLIAVGLLAALAAILLVRQRLPETRRAALRLFRR
jgi:hypothetical protein